MTKIFVVPSHQKYLANFPKHFYYYFTCAMKPSFSSARQITESPIAADHDGILRRWALL